MLHADVVGDGYKGAVSVHYAPRASIGCGFILVVKTRRGTLAARVLHVDANTSDEIAINKYWWGREPVLSPAVDLGRGRAQIPIGTWAAADGFNLELYGVVAGKLRLLQTAPKPSLEAWFYGGTIGAQKLPSCREGGPLLALEVWNVNQSGGPRWGFKETSYRLRSDGRFRRTGSRKAFGTSAQMWAEAKLAGWTGIPFGNCTAARVKRP